MFAVSETYHLAKGMATSEDVVVESAVALSERIGCAGVMFSWNQ